MSHTERMPPAYADPDQWEVRATLDCVTGVFTGDLPVLPPHIVEKVHEAGAGGRSRLAYEVRKDETDHRYVLTYW